MIINENKKNEIDFNNNWDLVDEYLANDIPNIITEETNHEFIVKNNQIDIIRKKYEEWNVDSSYPWIQFGIEPFITHKSELGMVIQKYSELEQAKIAEVFETGSV